MKRLIIFLFLISSLFANTFAKDNDHLISYEDIQTAIELQQTDNVDIVQEAKEMITRYYDRNTFNGASWKRVKNFLSWMEENKDFLNASFTRRVLKLAPRYRETYIGVFLGANYATKNMIDKWYNLRIRIGDGNVFEASNGIISASNSDFITGVNVGIHEAAHLLPLVKNKSENGDIRDAYMYPEEIAVFSNLKYGLPVRANNDIREGTRSYFMFANNAFIERNYTDILNEYSEVVYAAVNFSKYSADNFETYGPSMDAPIRGTLSYLISDKVMENRFPEDKEDLEYFNAIFLENPVFMSTVNEVVTTVINPKLNNSPDNTSNGIYYYTENLIRENQLPIARIFVKNLKKYADRNILPVPAGYI